MKEEFKKRLRPLTRLELKGLKAKGLSIAGINAENQDDVMDNVLELVFGDPAIFDNEPNPAVTAIFQAIIKLTYGSEQEEKN